MTGQGRFVADVNAHGQAHAAFVRSPHVEGARVVGGQGSVLLVDRTAGAPEGKLLGESPGDRLIAVERRC